MSEFRYIRDSRSGSLILRDHSKVSSFRQTKTLAEEIQLLKSDINTLKTKVEELNVILSNNKKSN
jgi:hypothetical protein